MLGAFVINKVGSYGNRSLVITFECCRAKLIEAEIFEKRKEPWISHVVMAMALYSASAEDFETTLCLLDFQDMGEEPKRIQ